MPETSGERDVICGKPSESESALHFPNRAFLWLFPIFFFLFCLVPKNVYALYSGPLYGLGYNPERVFRLSGEVALVYERDWTANSNARSYFTYYTDLVLSGFVVDPRIMTFQAGGNFGQIFNSPGETSTNYGFSLNTQLLNERPKKGPLQFFPRIELRYSFGRSEDTQTQNYGISLDYDLGKIMKPKVMPIPTQMNFGNTGNAGAEMEPKRAAGFIAWPTLNLDYDRYSFKVTDNETKTDHLSFRAASLATHAEYYADYEDYTYRDDTKVTFRTLDLEATFHFFNKERTSNLDIWNRLLVGESQGERQLTFTSSAIWGQRLGPTGRDSLIVNGRGSYFTSSNGGHNYELDLASSYNKFFSERFSNYASLGLGYGKSDDRTIHSETLGNMFSYALTPYLRFDNNLSVGNTQDGPLYGAGAGLAALSQAISATLSYQFNYQDVLTGNTKEQRISLDLSGSLFQNMTYYSQNYYKIVDVQDIISPFHQTDLYLSASMAWRIFRSTLSLGASYLHAKTDERGSPILGVTGGVAHNPTTVETAITTLNAALSTLLASRLTLNIYAFYQQEKDGPESFYLTPMLLWYYRKMTLDAEYTLRLIKRPGSSSTTEHRVYLRLTRLIDNALRPFW